MKHYTSLADMCSCTTSAWKSSVCVTPAAIARTPDQAIEKREARVIFSSDSLGRVTHCCNTSSIDGPRRDIKVRT